MEQQLKEWMEQLTLEEKAALTVGGDFWHTRSIERLGIPSISLNDGPHGIRKPKAGTDVGFDSLPATCFPTASALASSWDVELLESVGQAIGDECLALDVQVLLGPGVNIKRSPRGGRNFEYYSEDPVLAGEMGAAFVRGVQSRGIGTSLKHFACNNQEHERMTISSEVDERTLREIYLTAFERVIKQSQPMTVMAAYNKVNGIYATEHRELLEQVLREEWGFTGFVVSDWGAVNDKAASLRAGMDLQMPGRDEETVQRLTDMVRNGEFPETVLNQSVERILRIVLATMRNRKPGASFDAEAHHAVARQVAAECFVLLKNEGGLLPLQPDKLRSVSVIGQFAKQPRYQGSGSSQIEPTRVDTAIEQLKKSLGDQVTVSYADGYPGEDRVDEELLNEAAQQAAEADVAVIFAGLPPSFESEGFDRRNIDMPASHNRLIEEVCRVQPNTVVVLSNGSAVAMPWIQGPKAVLEGWLGGQASGAAAADVLLGAVNPSGKLSETFPMRLEDAPDFLNFPGEEGKVRYGEGLYVGYRYYDKKRIEPLFPFGYGLSYTTFELTGMNVNRHHMTDRDTLEVKVCVRNTGARPGSEVVQLYVQDAESRMARPIKELKAFAKVSLQPGEEKEVTLVLQDRDFAYYDSERSTWCVESGEFVILAGTSSADLPLRASVMMESTQKVQARFHAMSLFKDVLKRYTAAEALQMLADPSTGGGAPAGLYKDEFLITFMMDMPIGKIAKMMGNIQSEQAIADWISKLNGEA